MSPRARRTSSASHHVEWLQLVDVSGPFVSLGVLAATFPQGLDAVDPELAERLAQAYAEWQANREQRVPDAAIDTAFVDFVLAEVLEYPDDHIASGAEIDDAYVATLPEHRVTLRPDRIVRRPGGPPALLVSLCEPTAPLDKPFQDRGLHASPAERMRMLLARTGARSGLVTNGGEWTLVHAPPERTSTFVTWYANLLVEERLTLRAFRSLLGVQRLFGVDDPETLDGLFERSRDDEREVTDQLGIQARRAVELLVTAFDRADRESGGRITEGIRGLERNEEAPRTLYEAVVAVAMRIIFLLAAEARGLFPDDGPWVESYALTPLRAELEAQADRHGIEVLERRHDAWPRLLATFRGVHGGVEHGGVRMPGYGGGLFDPARYPFLGGDGDPVPRISNRTLLHALNALQTLEVDVPGGRERRPLSFRALGIEQIGHVYEGLLDHTALRGEEPALGLVGTKKKEPEIALSRLEEACAKSGDSLLELLHDSTGRSKPALRKALGAEASPERLARLRVACGHDDELVERVLPFVGLVRDDVFGDPVAFRAGDVFVTQSPYRRSTGTHYTPPSLTEPIVQYALEPVVYRGPAEGKPQKEWELKRASELLDLKICDIAMGSAAFLVAACRYLAARLVESWELHPEERPADAGEDAEERELTARRLVTERCLYGVDVNPLAVEIAKVSLWLTTLRRDRPFTFVDHALRCGDSLLGLTSLDQLEALTLEPGDPSTFFLLPARDAIKATLDEVREARERIEATDAIDLREIEAKASTLATAERKLDALKVVGDLVVGAALEEAAKKGKAATVVEAVVAEIRGALAAQAGDRRDSLLASVEARASDALMAGRAPGAPDPPRTFHWALEFPEVFRTDGGGFSAIVGNPPFVAGVEITRVFSAPYREYLVFTVANGQRAQNADIVAFFLRRATALLDSNGTFGLVTTNSAAQGDTRTIGLSALTHSGLTIYRAIKDRPWPGEAALTVSFAHATRGSWTGDAILDEVAVSAISASLDRASSLGDPHELAANDSQAFAGTDHMGAGFLLSSQEAEGLIRDDPRNADVVKPFAAGEEIAQRYDGKTARFIIDFGDMTLEEAMAFERPFKIAQQRVYPERMLKAHPQMINEWWRFWRRREALYSAISAFSRVLVGPKGPTKWWFVTWLPNGWVYSTSLRVFAYEDDAKAGVLSSTFHELWARKYSGSLQTGLRYSPTDCFANFPFPHTTSIARDAASSYFDARHTTCRVEEAGITPLYNRVYEDAQGASNRVEMLRRLRRELDRAVADAYGWTDLELDHDFRETPLGLRYTISDAVKTEALDRLLELNHARYAEEVAQGLHAKSTKRARKARQRSETPESESLFEA